MQVLTMRTSARQDRSGREYAEKSHIFADDPIRSCLAAGDHVLVTQQAGSQPGASLQNRHCTPRMGLEMCLHCTRQLLTAQEARAEPAADLHRLFRI